MNIFSINGGQSYAQAKGRFNKAVAKQSFDFFSDEPQTFIETTDINDNYEVYSHVQKFVRADIIIYHTHIWWMPLPYGLKNYFNEALNTAKGKGIWIGDGRSSDNF